MDILAGRKGNHCFTSVNEITISSFSSFFVIFGQIEAYKKDRFSAMKNEHGFEFSLNPTSANLLSAGSCRFFNTFTMLFQGLQILQFLSPAIPECKVSAV